MGTWLVEVRLQSHLGIDRSQLDRFRAAAAALRPRVVRLRRRHAAVQLVVDAPSELAALRAVDAALAVSLEAFWEIGWETEAVARLA